MEIEQQQTAVNIEELHARNVQLNLIAQELKAELFGIDAVIDRVIEAIRAWYVLPHIISRPVIVCLWGLTGTGKTQLTRRLAQKLNFYDRFVEVQMDGFSHGAGWNAADSISAMLGDSGVAEGEPAILVLDEFQRFRTVDDKGQDVATKRYQDVWQMLSDGRLAPSLGFLREIEQNLAFAAFEADQNRKDDDVEAGDAKPKAKPKRFKMGPWEARQLKSLLKLKVPLAEVMAWSEEQVQAELINYQASGERWETDYSRLLVFVCGNLDEMYQDMAKRVEDCDTDADIFHAHSLKLSLIDVKKALVQRFKPEQVARLGNQHIIYPSLARSAYERLIAHTANGYVSELQARSGLRFELDASVLQGIYANGVFPTQGTRPLFSTLHGLLSAPLVQGVVQALQRGALPGDVVKVSLDAVACKLNMRCRNEAWSCDAPMDVERLRQRNDPDFRALLAVHEAGHGLVYAKLFGQAPSEVKINVASFEGGYASFVGVKATSADAWMRHICVALAGRAAEVLVFGAQAASAGAEHDIKSATEYAARAIRSLGFGDRLSRTDVAVHTDDHMATDVDATNRAMEELLQAQMAQATALLRQHLDELMLLVRELISQGQVNCERAAEILKVPAQLGRQTTALYADLLSTFELQSDLIKRVRGGSSLEQLELAACGA
jgi:cell division protease FtsH